MLRLEDGEHEVHGRYLVALERLGLEDGHLQHLLGHAIQRQVADGGPGIRRARRCDRVFHHAAHLTRIDVERAQHPHGQRVLFFQQAQQQVGRADRGLPQPDGLVAATLDNAFDLW